MADPSTRKTIVVTGASSGIGAAITCALAEEGHRMFICARRATRLRELNDRLATRGRSAVWRQVDVAKAGEVAAFAAFLAGETASVDALICCAGGYGAVGRVLDLDPDVWWESLKGNLLGTFAAIREIVPLMKGDDRRIITFAGGGAFNPLPRYSAYAVSKSAVVRLTETLADELRDDGISINAVAPGFVKTEIHQATLEAGRGVAGSQFYEMTRQKLEAGSVPIDVPVACVKFLLSPAAKGLTGKTLSASFDPWKDPEFAGLIDDLNRSELYTMRRTNIVNLPDDPVAKRVGKLGTRS